MFETLLVCFHLVLAMGCCGVLPKGVVHNHACLNSSKFEISNSCGMGLYHGWVTICTLEQPWGVT